MHRLHIVYFVFLLLVLPSAWAAYDIDIVYEMQPGTKPIVIYNENYPGNYLVGRKYRYQITAPSYYRVKAYCSAYIGFNGNACSPDDLFIYIDDGTTNLYNDQSISGCGKFQGISFVSRYNSITFGTISRQFSGNFSCQISINPYPERCDCGWGVNTRIYNGTRPIKNALASLGALYSEYIKAVFCGCTLISENFAMTAAHCLRSSPTNDVSKMWLMVGRDDVTAADPYADTHYAYNYKIASIISHEYYNDQTYANDVGLVKTVKRMAWNRGVAPACMPTIYDTENQYVGKPVTFAGWGFTQADGYPSPVLLATQVTVCSLDYCKNQLQDDSVTTNQTCTIGFGHDACQRDSGGPALYFNPSISRYIVYGISSFGPLCGVNKPAVSTLVAAFLPWINARVYPMQSSCVTNS